LTGAKHPTAFSINRLADSNKTTHNYNETVVQENITLYAQNETKAWFRGLYAIRPGNGLSHYSSRISYQAK